MPPLYVLLDIGIWFCPCLCELKENLPPCHLSMCYWMLTCGSIRLCEPKENLPPCHLCMCYVPLADSSISPLYVSCDIGMWFCPCLCEPNKNLPPCHLSMCYWILSCGSVLVFVKLTKACHHASSLCTIKYWHMVLSL